MQFVTLLALSDQGAPTCGRERVAKLAASGVPSFACTPDAFPALMAASIRRDDIAAWASGQGLVKRSQGSVRERLARASVQFGARRRETGA